jgi:hypothetical protein
MLAPAGKIPSTVVRIEWHSRGQGFKSPILHLVSPYRIATYSKPRQNRGFFVRGWIALQALSTICVRLLRRILRRFLRRNLPAPRWSAYRSGEVLIGYPHVVLVRDGLGMSDPGVADMGGKLGPQLGGPSCPQVDE